MNMKSKTILKLTLAISMSASLLMVNNVVQAADLSKLPDPTRPYQWAESSVAGAEGQVGADTTTAGADATTGQSKAVNELTLDSILYGPDRRFTIINGQMMREGDVINKVKVIRIKPRFVVVQKNGEKITLTLYKSAEDQGMTVIRR